MDTFKVLIADDHTMVAKLIKHMLDEADNIDVLNVLPDGESVLRFLKDNDADAALLDIDMPRMDGIMTTQQIKAAYPNMKVIIISHHAEPWVIQKSIEAGASGYLTKFAEGYEVVDAVRSVCNGGRYFCKTTLKSLAKIIANKEENKSHNDVFQSLTKRERQIVQLIANEMTNKDISEKLFISQRTVETHRMNIMHKLGAKTTVGLMRILLESKGELSDSSDIA